MACGSDSILFIALTLPLNPIQLVMPVLLETKLKQRGAHYHKAAQPWGEKIVTDGLIVTGQNPGSAPAFGEAILAAIQATAH